MGRLDLIKKFSVPDAFTFLGGLFGLLAIYLLLVLNPDITLGTTFIILALIMDGCDGAAARRFGSKHDFGRHLDSIADAISFCLAPAVLVYVAFYPGTHLSIQGFFTLVTMALIIILGWTRLVIFSREGYKLENFNGLPSPANAFLIVIIAHVMQGVWFIALPLLLLGSILMVTPLPYPKLRGKTAVFLALAIGISFLAMITPRFTTTPLQTFATYQVISFMGFVIILAYMLGGPIYSTRTKNGTYDVQ